MFPNSALSIAVAVSLLNNGSVQATTLAGTKTKLKALQTLVLNNAQATIRLDSSALKQLLKLSSCEMVQMNKKTVGFSANVMAKQLELGGGQTIIYDKVLTNDGNGYDDRTGVFTCPVAGTYLFVVDSHSRGPTWLHIYLNKTIVATLHVSGGHKHLYLQMSRTVVLKLKRGDHVKVVNHAKRNGIIYHAGYSGFSGAKLY
ncbi:complement C1q-like protein 3 [Crassostrea virginica]